MIFKSKNNLHLNSFSALFIICSLITNAILHPITKIFLGLMGVDSFLILIYSVLLYRLVQVDISKIVAVNVSHLLLRAILVPDFLTNVCVSTATLIFLVMFLFYDIFAKTKDFSLQTFKRSLFLAFFIVDTLIVGLFAIISYYYFGLLKWIAIGSVITAPLAGAMTSFVMLFFTLGLISLYPKHFKRALSRVQSLR